MTDAALLSQASGMCSAPQLQNRLLSSSVATACHLWASPYCSPVLQRPCSHRRSLQLGFTAQCCQQRAKPWASPASSLADLSHVPLPRLCIPSGFLGLLDVVCQKWNCLNLAELRNAKKIKQTGVLLGDTWSS